MDSIYLLGAESVQTASITIHNAAGTMSSAASSLAEHSRRLIDALDEHARRMEVVVGRLEQALEQGLKQLRRLEDE